MAIQFEIEISPRDRAKLIKMLDRATPEMMDAIEVEWNDEGLLWDNSFKAKHLDAKPLRRSGFGRSKYRDPATPFNQLTRISSNLYTAMTHKITRPRTDVLLRSGMGIPGTTFDPSVLDYAFRHRKRMEIDKEFKSWSPKFVKAAKKGVARAIGKVNR